MSNNNPTPTILIRENTLLPEGLAVKSEAFFTGWRIIKNFDRSVFTRKIEDAKWYFFCLAGGIRASAVGRDRPGTLCRAVKRVLAKREGQEFNSLEITKVLSKRFLGIPFMSITAHSRHIQRDVGLVPEINVVLRPLPNTPESEPVSDGSRPHTEIATNQLSL